VDHRYGGGPGSRSGPPGDAYASIGKRRRDVDDARIAIDWYLDAMPRMAEEHESVQFAIRALDLAVLIGDKDRADQARTELMGAHRTLIRNKIGLWWCTVDRLFEDKKSGVTDKERAELVVDLENIVTTASNAAKPPNSIRTKPRMPPDA
jgi:hypothetical protein